MIILAGSIGPGAFSVWPHHATIALLHLAYLCGVWSLLRAHFGDRPSTLLGFAAAIATPLFFSYAPFISHELMPALLLLAMLFVGHRDAAQPTARRWWLLFALGTIATLIKQTYLMYAYSDPCRPLIPTEAGH